MRWLIIFMVLLAACKPPTATPTVNPPTVTPTPTASATPQQSPPITPTRPPSPIVTPPPSPLATPEAEIEHPLLMRASTVISDALDNGGFNLPYDGMPGYSTIQLPHGWKVGWFPKPPCTHTDHEQNGCLPVIQCPTNCILPNGNCCNDYNCYFAMPEANRVLVIEHEGLRTFRGRCQRKDFRQQDVEGLVFANCRSRRWESRHILSQASGMDCGDFANCSKGQRSDLPTAMHLRVGIDPYRRDSRHFHQYCMERRGRRLPHRQRFDPQYLV